MGVGRTTPRNMRDRPSSFGRLQSLCGAAGDLCSAYDRLRALGDESLAAEVLQLLISIDAAIAALEDHPPAVPMS